MKSPISLSALFFISCSIFCIRVLGQSGDFVHPFAEGTVIVDDKKGFMNYQMVTNDTDRLKLTAFFYDSVGRTLNNQSFILPKSSFLGAVYNGTRGIFLFENRNTSSLYNVIFEEQGKIYRFEEKNIIKGATQWDVVLSNDQGIYVKTRAKGGFTISKLNYDTDLLWTTEFKGEKKLASLTSIENKGNCIVLRIDRNRIAVINDNNGKTTFDQSLSAEPNVRQSFAHNYDINTKRVLIAGEEFTRNNLNSDASRYFYTQFDSLGNVLQNRSFPIPNLKISNSKDYKELKKEAMVMLIRDIFEVKDKVHLVGESVARANIGITAEKTGAAAIGVISGIALGAIIMPHQPSTLFVGVDEVLLTASDNSDSLNVHHLDKNPLAKLIKVDSGPIEHSNHQRMDYLGLFDYKFKLKASEDTYHLIYLHSKNDNTLRLAKATVSIVSEPIMAFFDVNENMKKITGYAVFKYSESSILIQLKFENESIFKIIDIDKFK